jgi:putative flippase GtrA
LISGIIGFFFPIPFVFLINRAWSFESNVKTITGLPKYFFVSVIALITHSSVQYFYVETLGGAESFSQLVGIFFSASINFTLLKLFVFNK